MKAYDKHSDEASQFVESLFVRYLGGVKAVFILDVEGGQGARCVKDGATEVGQSVLGGEVEKGGDPVFTPLHCKPSSSSSI